MIAFNTVQNFGSNNIDYKNADIYDIDLQINEEMLNLGPVPERSNNCTLKQCATQNNSSNCSSCWNNC